MFVHPSQIAAVVSRHNEIHRARLEVSRLDNADVMTLKIELQAGSSGSQAFSDAVADSVRDVCKLRAEVQIVDSGSLANDGKVIDDIRPLD
jgi:phenylacetate-CoA ligase